MTRVALPIGWLGLRKGDGYLQSGIVRMESLEFIVIGDFIERAGADQKHNVTFPKTQVRRDQ